MELKTNTQNNTPLIQTFSLYHKITMNRDSLVVAAIVAAIAVIYFSVGIGFWIFVGTSALLGTSVIISESVDILRWNEKRTIPVAIDNKHTSCEKSQPLIHDASAKLQKDRKKFLTVVRQNVQYLEHVREELKNDRAFILEAAQYDVRAFKYASAELKKDRDFILAAVEQDGFALEYASAELQNDLAIVLAAVEQNGFALQYASAELQKDPTIIAAAVKQDHEYVLGFALTAFTALKNNPKLQAIVDATIHPIAPL